jgi:hypothetical protein
MPTYFSVVTNQYLLSVNTTAFAYRDERFLVPSLTLYIVLGRDLVL